MDFLKSLAAVTPIRDIIAEMNLLNAQKDIANFKSEEDAMKFDADSYDFLGPKTKAGLQAKVEDFLVKRGDPRIKQFADQYETVSGDTSGRFMATQEDRQELAKAGVQFPQTGINPVVDKKLDDFILTGRQAAAQNNNQNLLQKHLIGYQQGNPESIAYVMANQQELKNMAEGNTFLNNRATQEQNTLKEQTRLIEDTEKTGNMRDFRSSASMLTVPMESGKYMPLGEAESLVLQAASDYPVQAEEVNKQMDNLRLQYQDTPDGAPRLQNYGVGRNKTQVLVQDFLAGKPQVTKVSSDTTPVSVTVNGQTKPAKPLPVALVKDLNANDDILRKIEQAVVAAKENPGAFGAKNYAFDSVVQRLDPEGVPARAAIGDLGSLIIRDRSGAAVTAAEFPRLRPFIPSPTDAPETVNKKLARFYEVMTEENDAMRSNYEQAGYTIPAYTPTKKATATSGPKVGAVVDGYKFKGGNPADPKNWAKVR